MTTIQVYEYQKIKIGEEIDGTIFTRPHFQALLTLAESQTASFYTIEHEAVRFKNYVGVIQVGSLCIEILPKLDQWLPSKSAIQGCLIEMLRMCRFLKVSTLSQATLSWKPIPLMELFWEFFLEEVAIILREGLLKFYAQTQSEKRYLKGRLLLHKQLRLQALGKESFFTASSAYDYHHPFNAALYQALQVLRTFQLSPKVHHLLWQTLNRFPVIDTPLISNVFFDQLAFNWKSKRYEKALLLARMILANKTPDVRSGSHPSIAMLFDMNLLFEEYIYQQLLRFAPAGAQLSHQENRLFWQKRVIRPDIVIRMGDKTIVVDTKWKLLPKGQPAMDDLRQMYVYNRYFEAQKGILLYPQLHFNTSMASPFHVHQGEAMDHGICEVRFVDLLKAGNLNSELGKELWQHILSAT